MARNDSETELAYLMSTVKVKNKNKKQKKINYYGIKH